MNNLGIHPVGNYVLVEIKPVEEKSAGGIVLPEDLAKKEQSVTQDGIIREFGPTCYVGWAGCEDEDSPAHEKWGVHVGDRVEFRKYEGKTCAIEGYENFRYIPDICIIGVIDNE